MSSNTQNIKRTNVALSGLLIEKTAHNLRDQMRDLVAENLFLDLDMEFVRYLDSACLGILVVAQKMMMKKGGNIRIINPSHNIADLMELTCMHQFFEVINTNNVS